jgi:hypothetical protein
MSSALDGIQKNLRQFDDAASRIASRPADTDLAADIIQLKIARHGISANAQTIRAADKTLGVLVDTFV